MSAYRARQDLIQLFDNLTIDAGHFVTKPPPLTDTKLDRLENILAANAGPGQPKGVFGLWERFIEWSVDPSQLDQLMNPPPAVASPPKVVYQIPHTASPTGPIVVHLLFPDKKAKNDPEVGYLMWQFLLVGTWQAGFSPRLYDRTEIGPPSVTVPSVLSFVPFPDRALATALVSLDVIANSANSGPFASRPGDGLQGTALRELIDDIGDAYQVSVRADASLLDQPVFLGFADNVSLAYVLDAIALHLNAAWEWNEDAAVLRSR